MRVRDFRQFGFLEELARAETLAAVKAGAESRE